MLALTRQRELVAALRGQLKRWEAARRPAAPGFTSGSRRWIGFCPSTVSAAARWWNIWPTRRPEALALALIAAREACREGGALVVVDRARQFYPPAAANLGIDLTHTIFCRARTQKDQLWALNQALTCQGVGAVLCQPARARRPRLSRTATGRRNRRHRGIIHPAHQRTGAAHLVGNAIARRSGACRIKARRRLRVELLRCRNASAHKSIELELDDETGTLQESRHVRVASAMAAAAVAKRTTGA